MSNLSQICLLTLLIPLLSSCASWHYYQQAASGQLSMMWNRVPVARVVSDPNTPAALKEKLIRAVRARQFAAERLHLPVEDSFTDYVDIGRDHVVYNVIATPEFSLQPHTWCYPLIGCQSYRGYFSLEDARDEQNKYKARGFDTFIGGVTAYSTLGWFDDPLQTGIVRLPDERMVALIFHELSHQQIYIADDTRFNESFANAVALEGLRQWLKHTGQSDLFARARQRLAHRQQTRELIERTASNLTSLYSQSGTLEPNALRSKKRELMAGLAQRYRALSTGWPEPGPLDQLLGNLNNAVLNLFQEYNSDVPGFRQLFRTSGSDFTAFYKAVRKLADASPEQRRERLDRLNEAFHENL